MAINNTLKDIREERNLVQADLAKAVGSCSDTIGRIERGERNASLEIAIRLAHYLKLPLEEIFKIEDLTANIRNPRTFPRFFFFANLFRVLLQTQLHFLYLFHLDALLLYHPAV